MFLEYVSHKYIENFENLFTSNESAYFRMYYGCNRLENAEFPVTGVPGNTYSIARN